MYQPPTRAPPGGDAAAIANRVIDCDLTLTEPPSKHDVEEPARRNAAKNAAAAAAAGGGVSWGGGVRQIDRTGQNLVCDSDTVVSGLTTPTAIDGPRPWEVGHDTNPTEQYDDPTDPCYTVDGGESAPSGSSTTIPSLPARVVAKTASLGTFCS